MVERQALVAVRAGNAVPIMVLLKSGRDRLHPDLQRELAIMMDRLGILRKSDAQ
jgi:hypothetical protein